jgi:GNAT superfamily N-acetyltransferase
MFRIARIESPADVAALGVLVREFNGWASARGQGAPSVAQMEPELAELPGGVFAPPGGCFLLAFRGERPAGCIAFRSRGEGTVELRRFYVSPAQRGRGLGGRLVRDLVAEARAAGHRRMVADSHRGNAGIQRLYRAAGFRERPFPQGASPAFRERMIFMELDLVGE